MSLKRYRGEVPRGFAVITYYFEEETDAMAFVSAEGVALWPTAVEQGQPDDEDDTRRRYKQDDKPLWLQDSIARQRAGFVRRMIYGPVERENYN